jgi:hypothetical protein
MNNGKKKASKRTVMVRAFCIVLAALMVLGVATYAIIMLLG